MNIETIVEAVLAITMLFGILIGFPFVVFVITTELLKLFYGDDDAK